MKNYKYADAILNLPDKLSSRSCKIVAGKELSLFFWGEIACFVAEEWGTLLD